MPPLYKIEVAVKRSVEKWCGICRRDAGQSPGWELGHGFHCGDNGIFKGAPVTAEERELARIVRKPNNRYGSDGKYILDVDCQIIYQRNASDSELCGKYLMAEINTLGE